MGKDSFQEVDIAGVVMPVTKHSFIVKNVHELANTIRRAFKIAQTGRPGPVLVDVTKDVTANLADYEYKKPEEIAPRTDTIKESDLEEVAKLIKKSQKPFLMVGGGVVASNAHQEFREFAKLLDAPVCDTLMGKGVMDGNDPHYTGMVGMHGTKTSNFGVTASDLLIVVGGRFSDRVIGNAKKFANEAKIVQIDVDPAEINKNIVVDASIVGDAKEVLKRLNQMIVQKDNKEWLEEIAALEQKFPNTYPVDILTGPTVISKIYEMTKGDAIITTDVGQHQMWAAQMYRYKEPRQLLTSGGLGTMGYGLGACIGAKMGRRDKVVVNIAGDGCFRMNMNEIATATRYNIPIIQVVINNHVLGMVRQWQTLFYNKHYSNTILNDAVDFVKVSEGMGALAFKATTISEFEDAFKQALDSGRPCVIDAQIDADDKVWPMVAAGQPISTCFSEEDLEK